MLSTWLRMQPFWTRLTLEKHTYIYCNDPQHISILITPLCRNKGSCELEVGAGSWVKVGMMRWWGRRVAPWRFNLIKQHQSAVYGRPPLAPLIMWLSKRRTWKNIFEIFRTFRNVCFKVYMLFCINYIDSFHNKNCYLNDIRSFGFIFRFHACFFFVQCTLLKPPPPNHTTRLIRGIYNFSVIIFN